MNSSDLSDSPTSTDSELLAASPSAWRGRLELEFCHADGHTRLSRSAVQAPQKVQRPFYPEGRAVCHVVTLHTAGGVVGGDRLSTQLHLHPHSHALITTATAGKIYRSTGLAARQETAVAIADHACLEWLPQETIVFNQAQYHQRLRVNLGMGAMWMGWEITRLGRSARGEKFEAGVWRSHTEIWQQGRLLWVDPQRIQGDSEMMTSPHGLNHYSVVASFAFLGRPITSDLVEKARACWQPNVRSEFFRTDLPQAQTGVSRLAMGLVCRYRGCSTIEARSWLVKVWHLLRVEYLQRPGLPLRVW